MDDVRATFNRFRKALNEFKKSEGYEDEADSKEKEEIDFKGEKEGEDDAKPYTREDELMSSAVQSAKTQFGADFTKFKKAMLYYPKDGDVTLSGEIPDMNSAKFQFRYKDANGCFLWVDNLVVTDDVVTKLSRMYGFYKNWKKELSNSEDIRPMSYRNEEGEDED